MGNIMVRGMFQGSQDRFFKKLSELDTEVVSYKINSQAQCWVSPAKLWKKKKSFKFRDRQRFRDRRTDRQTYSVYQLGLPSKKVTDTTICKTLDSKVIGCKMRAKRTRPRKWLGFGQDSVKEVFPRTISTHPRSHVGPIWVLRSEQRFFMDMRFLQNGKHTAPPP